MIQPIRLCYYFAMPKGLSTKKYDVFISHASEDKKDFVELFAAELRRRGLKVWYDKFELKIGDSLLQRIEAGLADSRYGIVVFSKAFLKNIGRNLNLTACLLSRVAERKSSFQYVIN